MKKSILLLGLISIFFIPGCQRISRTNTGTDPFPPFSWVNEGTSSGADLSIPYAREVSGLRGFNLSYSDADDRHILRMSMGNFDLYSEPKTLIQFADDSGDDPYDWNIDRQTLPPGTVFFEETGESISGFTKPLLSDDYGSPNGVPVLIGFQLAQKEGDFHIRELEVSLFPDAEQGRYFMKVIFKDDSADDSFTWRISYAEVPRQNVRIESQVEGTGDAGYTRLPIDVYHPVLQGFNFTYTHADHHVQQIQIKFLEGSQTPPQYLDVRFVDKFKDAFFDDFTYWVAYADLQE